MYWYGENTSNTFGDFRPEVHDSDGLLIQTRAGEWIWHPLSWSQRIQYNVYQDENPAGFGLLQRDRDFSHYQDLEAHYHRRPSLWVEPIKGFGKGAVTLIQHPTEKETIDNVVLLWEPATHPELNTPWEIEYNLRWFSDSPEFPQLAHALSTRIDSQDTPDVREFLVDFQGQMLNKIPADMPPHLDLRILQNEKPIEPANVRVLKNQFGNSWRARFTIQTQRRGKPVELICRLIHEGEPVTETWTYTWIP
jgi:glucans biosynthesis protein